MNRIRDGTQKQNRQYTKKSGYFLLHEIFILNKMLYSYKSRNCLGKTDDR